MARGIPLPNILRCAALRHASACCGIPRAAATAPPFLPSRALRRHGERASGEPRRRSRVDEVGVRGLCSPTAVMFSSAFQDPRAAAPVHAHCGGPSSAPASGVAVLLLELA
ncbi:hypothetical protein PVAP13_8KG083484 [Panicum virgatum]|uniref:Uncharacterized protein n=1 Tax=Panicum virgatum TaxID=38727 RepID=A0A8T0PNU8_PANVG|nr:hypothetical protein PVAP13_8KG083484 [Panicum virgatum]